MWDPGVRRPHRGFFISARAFDASTGSSTRKLKPVALTTIVIASTSFTWGVRHM